MVVVDAERKHGDTECFEDVEAERRGVFGPLEFLDNFADELRLTDVVRTILVDPATEVVFSTCRDFVGEPSPLPLTCTSGKLDGGTEEIRLLESDGIWLLDNLLDASLDTAGTGTGTSTAAVASSILFDMASGLLDAESARTVVLPLKIDRVRRLVGVNPCSLAIWESKVVHYKCGQTQAIPFLK